MSTFRNPIFPGFYPGPSIYRAGKDQRLVDSTPLLPSPGFHWLTKSLFEKCSPVPCGMLKHCRDSLRAAYITSGCVDLVLLQNGSAAEGSADGRLWHLGGRGQDERGPGDRLEWDRDAGRFADRVAGSFGSAARCKHTREPEWHKVGWITANGREIGVV